MGSARGALIGAIMLVAALLLAFGVYLIVIGNQDLGISAFIVGIVVLIVSLVIAGFSGRQ